MRTLPSQHWNVSSYPVRFRKLIGAVAFFVLVLAWALIAMAVAQSPAIRDTTVYQSCIMSSPDVSWVLPAMPPTSHTTNINGITLWILEA